MTASRLVILFVLSFGELLAAENRCKSKLLLLPQSDLTEQNKLFSRIAKSLSSYGTSLPEFACAQPTIKHTDLLVGASRPINLVFVDMLPPANKDRIGMRVDSPLYGFFQELAGSKGDLKLLRWVSHEKPRVALVQYSADGHVADISVDADSGMIFRIVFRGFNVSRSFTPLHCWPD